MDFKKAMKNYKQILDREQLNRCKKTKINNENALFLELHDLKTKEAKRLIQNVVVCTPGEGIIALNHGYRHGNATKKMISNTVFSRRIVKRETPKCNPGMTYLTLAS